MSLDIKMRAVQSFYYVLNLPKVDFGLKGRERITKQLKVLKKIDEDCQEPPPSRIKPGDRLDMR